MTAILFLVAVAVTFKRDRLYLDTPDRLNNNNNNNNNNSFSAAVDNGHVDISA